MKNHFTIPIFIPELACPHQCVFCNQRKISGSLTIPGPDEIVQTIQQHLETIPEGERHVEIGFFGGNFTGISITEQEKYLIKAFKMLQDGSVDGIRLSTRPDYIDENILELLKRYRVGIIELGAQSMVDEVLAASGRGHKVADTVNASEMILDHGFELGLQMMIGLPEDTLERSLYTAQKIVELGANNTRIYPTLVIRETTLSELYMLGSYNPLTLEEAVGWSKEVYKIFEKSFVAVIRMGLHPSEGLINGEELVAGPFHPSFKELVMTELWKESLNEIEKQEFRQGITVSVNPKQYNFAIGYHAKNRKLLNQLFNTVKFKSDPELKGRAYYVDYH